jgi:pimeloyl-ACP methyl ester carboxylesterase
LPHYADCLAAFVGALDLGRPHVAGLSFGGGLSLELLPTLLLYGDKDVRSPLGVAEDLHARIPASRLAVMAGVGHLSDMDEAERFNAEVRTFLRAAPS